MLRQRHIRMRWFSAAVLALYATTSSAIEYPGPAPGRAKLTTHDGKLELQNAVLAVRWAIGRDCGQQE